MQREPLINKEDNVLILSTAVTKWHALGVDLWLQSLYKRFGKLNGNILFRPHAISGFLLSVEDIPSLSNPDMKTNVIEYTNQRSLLRNFSLLIAIPTLLLLPIRNMLLKPKHPVHIAAPFMVPWTAVLDIMGLKTLLIRGVAIYKIDEGFATYIPTKMWNTKRARENFSNSNVKLLNLLRQKLDDLQLLLFRYLDSVLLEEDRCLFEVDTKYQVLIPQNEIVNTYAQKVLELSQQSVDQKDLLMRIDDKPIALLITQPWSEGGELDFDLENQLLCRVIDLLIVRGYCVRIKTHPRESIKKYKSTIKAKDHKIVKVIQYAASAENIFLKLSSKDVVIGFFSTALLNAKLFNQLSTFSVPEQWFLDVQVPDELYESQYIFKQYTRSIIEDLTELPSVYPNSSKLSSNREL